MPRRSTDRVGGRVGSFVIESELGRGGMGAVYRVRHAETGAAYALKVILPEIAADAGDEALARFRREVEVAARLDGHPGIVRVFTTGIEDGCPWYVMELVDGEPLAAREGPIPAEEGASLVARLAGAVEHAHEGGVLHRDLKPANVIIDATTGTPRVLDFGLAADLRGERLTRTGQVVGTPAYMSPEQLGGPEDDGDGADALGPATDVWALGAILYRLLTGVAPFQGDSPVATMTAVLTKHPRPPRDLAPELSRDLEAVCLKALEKRVADRYPSAAALAEDLQRWASDVPTHARPIGRLRRVGRRIVPARGARRTATLGALAAVAVVAAATGLGTVVILRSRTRLATAARGRAEREPIFERACRGDLEALEEIHRLLAEAEARGDHDPDLRPRRKVVDQLRALVAGDELPRFLESDRRTAVVCVLASARIAALAELIGAGRLDLDEGPILANGTPVAVVLAEAIRHGKVPPRPRTTTATLAALGGGGDASLRHAVLERRIAAIVGPSAPEEVANLRAELPGRLLALAEVTPEWNPSNALANDLATFFRDWSGDKAAPDGDDLIRTLRILLVLRSRDDPTDDPDAMSVWASLIGPLAHQMMDGNESRNPRALDIGLTLYGMGEAAPDRASLEILAEHADLGARLRSARRADRALVPEPAAALLELYAEQAAREAANAGEDADRARQDAIREHWWLIDRLVAREVERGDVSPSVLRWITRRLEDASQSGRFDEGGENATCLRLAPGATGKALGEAIDELWRRALDPERVRAMRAPMLAAIVLNHGIWWHRRQHPDRPVDARVVELLADTLDGLERLTTLPRWSMRLWAISVDAAQLLFEARWAIAHTAPADHPDGPCPLDGPVERIATASSELVRDSWEPLGILAEHHRRHGRLEDALAAIERGIHAQSTRDTARTDVRKASIEEAKNLRNAIRTGIEAAAGGSR